MKYIHLEIINIKILKVIESFSSKCERFYIRKTNTTFLLHGTLSTRSLHPHNKSTGLSEHNLDLNRVMIAVGF